MVVESPKASYKNFNSFKEEKKQFQTEIEPREKKIEFEDKPIII